MSKSTVSLHMSTCNRRIGCSTDETRLLLLFGLCNARYGNVFAVTAVVQHAGLQTPAAVPAQRQTGFGSRTGKVVQPDWTDTSAECICKCDTAVSANTSHYSAILPSLKIHNNKITDKTWLRIPTDARRITSIVSTPMTVAQHVLHRKLDAQPYYKIH